MKTTVSFATEPKTFKPIKVEIILESRQEVVNFYAHTNAPINNVKPYGPTLIDTVDGEGHMKLQEAARNAFKMCDQ